MEPRKILFIGNALDGKLFESAFSRQEGFETFSETNGESALEVIGLRHPDLVFIDFNRGSGVRCCAEVKRRQESREVPVVMMARAGVNKEIAACRNAGCDTIMFKPILAGDFLSTTRHIFEMSSLRYHPTHARMFVYIENGTEHPLSDFSVDLSTGVLILGIRQSLPANALLTVRFILPIESREIVCNARAAEVPPPGQRQGELFPVHLGLQFQGLSLENMDVIRKYLRGKRLLPSW